VDAIRRANGGGNTLVAVWRLFLATCCEVFSLCGDRSVAAPCPAAFCWDEMDAIRRANGGGNTLVAVWRLFLAVWRLFLATCCKVFSLCGNRSVAAPCPAAFFRDDVDAIRRANGSGNTLVAVWRLFLAVWRLFLATCCKVFLLCGDRSVAVPCPAAFCWDDVDAIRRANGGGNTLVAVWRLSFATCCEVFLLCGDRSVAAPCPAALCWDEMDAIRRANGSGNTLVAVWRLSFATCCEVFSLCGDRSVAAPVRGRVLRALSRFYINRKEVRYTVTYLLFRISLRTERSLLCHKCILLRLERLLWRAERSLLCHKRILLRLERLLWRTERALLREGLFHFSNDGFEGFGAVDGEVGEHFAVDFYPCLVEVAHKLGVGHTF